jgi:hypothetical protein
MNMNAATRALVWKEIRQAMPLVWMVFALGLILNLFSLLGSLSQSKAILFEPAFVAVSMIFATGIGVLLVGNEKDQRTLLWLQSLPVSPQTISRVKILVALGSILVVWILSLLMQWILWQMVNRSLWFRSPFWTDVKLNPATLVTFPLTSLFLGLAGMAAAWLLRSSIYALLALIPISVGLFALSQGAEFIRGGDWSRTDSPGWAYAIIFTVATVAAGWLGWRASLKTLGPAAAPLSETQRIAWSPTASQVSSSALSSPAIPLHALAWQMMAQNRGLWLALLGTMLVAVGFTADVPHADPLPHPWLDYMGPFGQLLLLTLWIGMCVLGCSVFFGDNLQHRIRFLADRGVSPSRVWWTRQWVPLLILVGICFARMGFRAITSVDPDDREPQLLLWDFCRSLCFAAALYVVSQWLAQCLVSPILCVCIAPLFAFGMSMVAIFAMHSFEAPWWTLGLSLVVLLLATFWQTKPWMDRALGVRYYVSHGVFLGVACLVPLLPGIWRIATLPRMPSEVRTALESEWQQLSSQSSLLNKRFEKPLMPHVVFSTSETLKQAPEILSRNEAQRQQFSAADSLLADMTMFVQWRGWEVYLSELADSRERLDLEPTDANRESYRRLVESTLHAIRMLRNTYTLRNVDVSENLELALLRDMRRSSIASDLGDTLYQDVVKLLSNTQERDAGRRASLAYEWHSSNYDHRASYVPTLGGYYLIGDDSGSLISYYSNRGLADRVTTDLWRLMQMSPGQEASAQRERIAKSYRLFHRSAGEVTPEYVWVPSDGWRVGPGSLWRGAWEQEAAALASALPSNTGKE